MDVAGVNRITLPPVPKSAGQARQYAAEFLIENNLTEIKDITLLLVSEIATNAILHACTEFTIDFVLDGITGVQVKITDSNPSLPKQRFSGTKQTTGRGLGLVSTLATEHGVVTNYADNTKTIWFAVHRNNKKTETDTLACWADLG